MGKSAITLPKEIGPDHKKRMPVPYGSIVKLTKDKLAVTFYDTSGAVFVLFSEDDGRTWGNASVLTKEYGTETTLLRLRPDRLLAVSRAGKGPDPDWWLRGLRQYVSEDEGRTWFPGDVITIHNEHPGHFLRLKDGRILVTFGMRNARKVGFRVSADEGRTWEPTRVLTDLPTWEGLKFDTRARVSDLGYPSTVQLNDGSFVTAWYSIGTEQRTRYHMGTVLWKLK